MSSLVKRNKNLVVVVLATVAVSSAPMTFAAAQAAAPAKQQQSGGVVTELKSWARVQWRTIKSYWKTATGAAPAPTAVAAKPVAKPIGPAASAPSVPLAKQPTLLAPPTSNRQPSAANTIMAPSAPTSSAPVMPGAPAQAKLQAPMAAPKKVVPAVFEDRAYVEVAGLKKSDIGVPVYDLSKTEKIPRLSIGSEERLSASTFKLDTRMQKIVDDRVITAFDSPEVLGAADFKKLTTIAEMPKAAIETKDVIFSPKGKVSRAAFDKIAMSLKTEPKINLGKFKFLTQEELRFLSGLLLYQQGDKCAAAVGLFHQLSTNPEWQSESNYYLAMCSRKLGLTTDFYERTRRVFDGLDQHYSLKLIKEIGHEVPYEFTEGIGTALAKIVNDPKIGGKFIAKLDEKAKADVAYILTDYGAATDRFKLTLVWAKDVPKTHPKYLNAQFLLALAEYQVGSKKEAFAIQERLINDTKTDKSKLEFQALVALNLGRMAFQEREFKLARTSFQSVYKDHPLWLQSLTEMGWAQLMSEDFEGAIGNMYSIQSPFFANVYKPESYVIRTVGYLNLCQFGDAYKTLSMLEHNYRPSLEKMTKYISANGKKGHYETVKNFLRAPKDAKEVDGLPVTIIREMARHRDFTNLQKGLNRQLDERPKYNSIEGEIDRSLKRAQAQVTVTRKGVEGLKKRFASAKMKPELEKNAYSKQLEKELENLNDLFFQVDLYTDAKQAMTAYKTDVIGGADKRLDALRSKTEQVLANRLLKMKVDLARTLDNNELLRYEVFAGSGENIRFQVAGGDVANRVPANTIPKSKSLQWDFDGEYWEDEIGNYRTTLKNNCPNANGHQTASAEGAVEE